MIRTTRARVGRRLVAAAVVLTLPLGATMATASSSAAAEPPAPETFHSAGNPIIADGSYYTADAAPLVDGDRLYLYTGHDEAAEQEAGFEMHDYAVLSTGDVASGDWSITKGAMRPGDVFSWATGNNAYAGQTVKGQDGRYYWYVPVQTRDTTTPNPMAIGVAVSDQPTGPWVDAIGEPLLTWTDVFGDSTNGQEIIDPAIFRDDDGTTYLYWGSWGVARMVTLDPGLTSYSGPITTLSGIDGFYEAPWVFKRNGTYYMAYDWKVGGSACTPSNYQACVAYATATSPTGPWTYRGIILGGTSATTVHPSIIEFKNQWYLTYHTKDATGGGHFRRSVAIDKVSWDGDVIKPVEQTWATDPRFVLDENVARDAQVSASYTEQPPMRLGALNDGRALTALLPPDQWGNYRGTSSTVASDWISYQWPAPVRIGSAGIEFHRDGNWIRSPKAWRMEYLDAHGDWQPIQADGYPTSVDTWHTVSFEPVTTTALRATIEGQPEGGAVHSVAVSEWEVNAVEPTAVAPVHVETRPGTAPALPEAVRLSFDNGTSAWSPVTWKTIEPGEYAEEGTFTVEGRASGYDAALVTAKVTVTADAEPPVVDDQAAPEVSVAVLGTQGDDGWFSSAVTARVRAEDETSYRTDIETRTGSGDWTLTSDARWVDVPVATDGETTISGRATDPAGHTSEVVSRTVKIDRTAPAVTADVGADRATTITAVDALSGLRSVEYRFDDAGDWATWDGSAPVAAPDSLPHKIVVRATDVAGNISTRTADVPPGDDAEIGGNIAPYAAASASYTSPWENVDGLNDGTGTILDDDASKLGAEWGTWPQVGEQWARYTWPFDVSVDTARVWWFQDADDTDNAGMIAPRSWVLQYLDEDGTTWRDVTLTGDSAYARDRDMYVPVTFEPVTTRSLRIVAQSWGDAEAGGSAGIREWQVIAAGDLDITAPEVTLVADPAGPDGTNSWYRSAVQVSASATDNRDDAPVVEMSVDAGPWAMASQATVDEDGTHTVRARARDAAGNTSPVAQWSGRLDRTAPVSKATWDVESRTVTLRAADDTSSVSTLEYALDDGAWTAYTGSFTIDEQVDEVKYRSVDEAGNQEGANRLSVAGTRLASTTTTVAARRTTIAAGSPFLATVIVGSEGGARPTGSVRVLDGNAEVAQVTLVGGSADVRTSRLTTAGTHRLTFLYSGDDQHESSSAEVSVRVGKAAPGLRVTTRNASRSRATSVVASFVAPPGMRAQGTVTLRVDGRRPVRVAVAGNKAIWKLRGLEQGLHRLTLVYRGDSGLTRASAVRHLRVR